MEPITPFITECTLSQGERVFIAPTKAKDVVSIQGSVLGGRNMLPPMMSEAAVLAAELLDAGTNSKSKDAIRGALADRGASLSFSSGDDRTYFSGSCLPEDLPALLKIAAECLDQANFPASELKVAKERALGDFEEDKSDTKVQAATALQRMLFDPTHQNYTDTTTQRIEKTASTTRTDLSTFGKKLGRGGLVLAIVGDVKEAAAQRAVEAAFVKIGTGTLEVATKKKNIKRTGSQEKLISIKDKANIDVYFGAAVPLTYKDPAYIAFGVFTGMLGGRGLSTGHLMRTIRERDGLTYGIYAVPSGFNDGADGTFRIWATFSPATFQKAVAATRREIGIFSKSGITSDTLQTQQDKIVGNYLVGLSTTGGLASTLHKIGIEGKNLSYLDTYPDLIRELTVQEIQNAKTLVPLDNLSLSAAGTFAK
jgi:zinc protease